jgi:F5/8 type C domain
MKINRLSFLMLFCAIAFTGISGSAAFGQDKNLALKVNNPKVTATQSSVSEWAQQKWYGVAANAIDGELIGDNLNKIAETKNETDSWFEVDLGAYYKINRIVIYPRAEACCQWFKSGYLIVTDQPTGNAPITDEAKIKASANFNKFLDPAFGPLQNTGIPKEREISTDGSIGRYVRIQIKGSQPIQLSEIQIFGDSNPVAAHIPDPKKAWNSTTTAGTGSSTGGASTSGAVDPKNLTRNPNVKINATQSAGNPYTNTPAKNAIDGNQDTFSETSFDGNGWFEVDLGDYYTIDKIKLYPRKDCCVDMFRATYIIISDHSIGNNPMLDLMRIGYSSNYFNFFEPLFVKGAKDAIPIDTNKSKGRYIRLQTKGANAAIELAEIEIFGEKAQNYTANAAKKWDTPFVAAFDPNYPDFQGATPATFEYWDTLQRSPKIIGVKNSDTSFDIAFQDNFAGSKLIRVNTYVKDVTGFKKNASDSMDLQGLGVFGGFAKNGNDRFILTTKPWQTDFIKPNVFNPGTTQLYKNKELFWEGKFYENMAIGPVKAFMHRGGSRLTIGKNSLLITANAAPAHPYEVILDTQDKTKNTNRAFYESTFHHNFGQRAIFDGTDFVIMENRDHDVSVTLTKLKPGEVLPLVAANFAFNPTLFKSEEQQKQEGHALEYAKRIFSVYSHTNFANNTYTELGNVEKGFDDKGYLVLFAGERDWNYKTTGYYTTDQNANPAPNIFSPRDIGLVHVKQDFDKETANWVDKDGKLSMCPAKVDNSSVVNSTGAKTTINYKVSEDGWDWAKNYNADGPCKTTLKNDRVLETKGVKWITTLGASYTAKAPENTEFTSVNHPKLVRISKNNYIVLWEEWKAEIGKIEKTYLTTKAALITLSGSDAAVNIQSSAIKDLGKVRLMPGDDAFEFDGKAAWAVGDATKGKLMFYTVDSSLNLASNELEL